MFVDLPESELRAYRSSQNDPADFDAFWESTLAESRAFDLDVTVTPVDTGLATIDVFDVTFSGFGGERIKAWLRLPAGATGPIPAVVNFMGYGGGRGRAIDNLLWASAGFAHFHMDTRGQGSGWSTGDTPDPAGTGPQVPGLLTKGIDSKETYYYRRLFTDAVRAVEAARSLDVVDSTKVAVLGGSQGGAMAVAAAAFIPDLSAVISYVTFLSDFPRATVITNHELYDQVVRYLAIHREKVDQVHETLSYFDAVNMAKRAKSPAWFSTGLMDRTCPPSTVFGAFNNYAGEKQITVWPYNDHEGGGIDDFALTLTTLREVFAA
ncbi:MAG: acetylxylan esterase [Leifsonia sp.]|jgi:cephalosporin-C deacetylase|nr:acetylxylan esterase [Leifsonia sp.]MDQ1589118.1 cephalosporin-C deacetylase [Microbacteriaceae bacterium]